MKPAVVSAEMELLTATLCFPPEPSLEEELQLFGSKLLRLGPSPNAVWTHSFGADFFLHKQEIGKLVGNM